MRIPLVGTLATIFLTQIAWAQEPGIQTSVQTGHYDKITSLAYSPDGNYLYSGSADLTIKLWELKTQREIRTFSGFSRRVTHMAVSPDGKELISISQDSLVWGWDPGTGENIFKLKDTLDVINNAIYTPDNKYLITGGKKYTAAIWDRETRQIIKRLEGKGLGCYSGICAGTLSISQDGRWLVAGLQDYFVEVWDLKNFELTQQIKTKRGSCSSCTIVADIHPKGNQLLSSSGRDSLQFWQRASGQKIPFRVAIEEAEKVKYSPSGNALATTFRGTFKLLDLQTGTVIIEAGGYPDKADVFVFAPNGRFLAFGGGEKIIKIIRLSDGREQFKLSGYASEEIDSLAQSVRNWAKNITKQDISPDGKWIAEPRGSRVLVWELKTGRIIKRFETEESRIIAVSFSPDGKYLAAAGGDRLLRLWDLSTNQLFRTIKGHGGAIFSMDFSDDGKYIVTGSWDATMMIWDINTGRRYGIYRTHEVTPITVSFMPGNLYLISGGLDERLLMTEVDTGDEVREFIGHRTHVSAIDYSPDGRFMLTGSWDEMAKLWDLNTGLQVKRFAGHTGPVYDVAFSDKGKWIATASWDKTAKVWDPDTGKEVFTFSGNTGAIVSVNFTPDEKYLVTWSRNGATKVWNLENGKELFTQIITGDDQWLVKSPLGYFYATDQAKKSIFFVQGLESYDIERFYDQFYKPGLLQEIYEGTGTLNQESLLNKLEESPPPTVEIVGPDDGKLASTASIEILYKVTNTGGGIDEVRIMNNGKRVLGDKVTEEKVQKKGRSMFRTVNVDLVPGKNSISISAFSRGRIESRAESIDIIREGVPAKPRCFILSIGINEYKNPSMNLNYAKSDASSFSKTVKQNGKKLFDKIVVYSLLDKEASRDNIFEAITEIAMESGPQDVFFMFYAGHGSLVNEVFYFIPSEVVRLYDEPTLQKGAISDKEMQEMLKNIKAQKQMIVLDACHSGQSTEVLAARGGEEEKALAQLSRSAGVHVLAAAGSQQTATEFEILGHGLFTYLLLEALDGQADGAPKDGKVTVFELRSYIDNLVPEYALKYKGAPQYPNTFSRGNDFPVIMH